MKRQRMIAIDFDGVIHGYTSGYTGAQPLDPPVTGARAFIEELLSEGWQVVVHTCRGDTVERKAAVKAYLATHGFPDLPVTDTKPAAHAYLDDRGLRFEGDWEAIKGQLEREPWYREGGV